MSKHFLGQVDEIIKLQHKHLESLSPEQRRAEVVQLLHAQVRHAQRSALSIGIVGLLILVIAIYFWFGEYHVSPMSSLGIIGGVILAALGFWYMNANSIRSRQKILSNNFTDADVLDYFREHETINQRTAVWWNKGGKFVLGLSSIILAGLTFYRPTAPFGAMMLLVALSVFFMGLAIIIYVQKTTFDRNSDS